MRRLMGVLAAIAIAVYPAPVDADVLSRGRAVAERFLDGQTGAVWAEMSNRMKEALGAEEAFSAVRKDLREKFGEEAESVSERVRSEASHDVYERISYWTGSSAPLKITVAFDGGGRVAGLWVRPQPVAADSRYLDYRTKADLRLPFDGAWYVYWGGRSIEDNYHAVDPGQRFAVDFLVMRDGESHSGDPGVLANYRCWNRPVLAPGEGTVVRAVDGNPDQAIGEVDPENPAGNHVVVDVGGGEYAFLAHLRMGSVTVSDGDRVVAGDEVGRCGNSGNSSEPHLHFHLQTTPELGAGEGLPAQFSRYLADGERVEDGEPVRGQTVEPGD